MYGEAQHSESPVGAIPFDQAWYALQTRPRHEKVVASRLDNEGFVTFLPMVEEVRYWSDRRKWVKLPLFSSYVFVRFTPSIESRLQVLRVAGVQGLVGDHGEGTPIPDQQVENIQMVLTRNVPCINYPFLRVGHRVRIRGGCLDGIEGTLVSLDGERGLVISVELIQRSFAISIAGYDVEKI